MRKFDVMSPDQALAYIADCNLATVANMAMKKKRGKHEFERQISIAQIAVDWIVEMGIDASTTRVDEVIDAGSVHKWASKYITQ